MKKQILILTVLAATTFSQNANAQSGWTPTSPNGDLYTNSNTDNVGIGTSTPIDKLTINGGLSFDASSYNRSIRGRTTENLEFFANTSLSNGSVIAMRGDGSSYQPGAITIFSGGNNSTDPALEVRQAGSNDLHLFINKNGNTVLGDNTPGASYDRLTVNGGFSFTPTSSVVRSIRGRTTHDALEVFSCSGLNDGSTILMHSNLNSYHPGVVSIISGGNSSGDPAFEVKQADNNATHMYIRKDGKVVIGNTSPNTSGYSNYKLFVEGGILTERVKVAISGSGEWSDYVFADNYNLKPLEEVEAYINKNKHLPDVPSAEAVINNGIDVAKMDATLLQKIEELTLYVIEQQKQINDLKSRLNK